MFLIPSAEMVNETGVSVGFYTPKSLISGLLAKVIDNYKQETADNPFAVFGAGLLAMMTPVLESAVETTIEDVCAGRDPSINKILDAAQ